MVDFFECIPFDFYFLFFFFFFFAISFNDKRHSKMKPTFTVSMTN